MGAKTTRGVFFHSVTLLALGCCASLLSRKEGEKQKVQEACAEKQAFPLGRLSLWRSDRKLPHREEVSGFTE